MGYLFRNLLRPRTMAQRPSGYVRKERDLYETPEWVTKAVIPYLPYSGETVVLEPCCASGKIVRVLRQHGMQVEATDIVTSFGTTGMDFLDPNTEYNFMIDGVVSNPPFGRLAPQVVRKAIKMMKPVDGFVAMLLPMNFDCAKTRRDIFQDCPAWDTKLVLTKRIVWFEREDGEKAAPSENHAWYVWNWARNRMRHATTQYYYEDEE